MALWLTIKVVHILAGMFWLGAAVVNARFLLPATASAGPAGGAVMKELALTRYPAAITGAAIVATIAGLVLLWHVTLGFQPGQFGGFFRVMLSIGMTAGLLAFFHGLAVTTRLSKRMATLVTGLQGPPTPDQQAELKVVREKLLLNTRVAAWLLMVALVAMALSHPL